MAQVQLPGKGLWMPAPFLGNGNIMTTGLIDATGEKVAMCGRVWNKERASKNITKVGWRFGSVTKAGGSGLTVSLQDVSTSAATLVPDETQDQTAAVANGDAAFATNQWYQSPALSAVRAVNFADMMAVVWEYDGGGRLGSDSVIISAANNFANAQHKRMVNTVLKTGGTWASLQGIPNVVLEFDDGTFGGLMGGTCFSALTNQAFNNASTPDEYCLEFQVPFACKTEGFFIHMIPNANTRDYSVVLYDGTTAMTGGTVACDANQDDNPGAVYILEGLFSQEISLTANHTYRLALQPTTANSINLYYIDVANANHLQALGGGTSWVWNSRTDLGAWGTATTTRQPLMGIIISSVDSGAGGGGLLTHPGMAGGARG